MRLRDKIISFLVGYVDEPVRISIAKQASGIIGKFIADYFEKATDKYRLRMVEDAFDRTEMHREILAMEADEFRLKMVESSFARAEHKQAAIDKNQNAINRRMAACSQILSVIEDIDTPQVIHRIEALEQNHRAILSQFRHIQDELNHIRKEGNNGRIMTNHLDAMEKSKQMHLEIVAMEARVGTAYAKMLEMEAKVGIEAKMKSAETPWLGI